MKKALKITGLATLALIVLGIGAITFAVIGVLFVIITASGIIVLAVVGIVTPKEKFKKIAKTIEIAIEDCEDED